MYNIARVNTKKKNNKKKTQQTTKRVVQPVAITGSCRGHGYTVRNPFKTIFIARRTIFIFGTIFSSPELRAHPRHWIQNSINNIFCDAYFRIVLRSRERFPAGGPKVLRVKTKPSFEHGHFRWIRREFVGKRIAIRSVFNRSPRFLPPTVLPARRSGFRSSRCQNRSCRVK